MSVASDVKKAQKILQDRSDKLVRLLMFEVVKRIILRTPVDTGRARGNWTLGIGTPDRSITGATDKSGVSSISKAQAELASARAGGIIFVTNSLVYILPLEHGSSGQAPAGMVKITVAELQPIASRVAQEVKRR